MCSLRIVRALQNRLCFVSFFFRRVLVALVSFPLFFYFRVFLVRCALLKIETFVKENLPVRNNSLINILHKKSLYTPHSLSNIQQILNETFYRKYFIRRQKKISYLLIFSALVKAISEFGKNTLSKE